LTVKKASDSATEQVYIIRSQHINSYGRLFGGYLMQWMDELAAIVSRRHCGSEVTTAAVDNLNFKAGAYMGDMVALVGKLVYVGRTSMEVRIDAYVEDRTGIRRNINRAYIVMVAVDQEGRAVEVPRLDIETETERAEWAGGEKRYQLRKQRRIEGY
jgi:acyl-CoA hydrolase